MNEEEQKIWEQYVDRVMKESFEDAIKSCYDRYGLDVTKVECDHEMRIAKITARDIRPIESCEIVVEVKA